MEEMFLREEDPEEEKNYPHNKSQYTENTMLKPDILRNKKDFNRLYKKGKSYGSKYVVLFCIKNDLLHNRKAFLASKKVGNSVKRNRARRLMKESFRKKTDMIKDGYDILFIARNNINGSKCQDVEKSINQVLRKAGLLKKE